MIVQPEEMDYSQENVWLIFTGMPGTGKTFLGCSAPGVAVIDADNGMKRIYPASFRKPAIPAKYLYEDIKADIKDMVGKYNTLVFDTGGALIEKIKSWAMRTDPSATKKSGGISQSGFGTVKTEFLSLVEELKLNFNVVFLFHEKKETNSEKDVWYEIMCEGSARDLVWQPADLAGHLFIQDGKRYIGFSPTSNYNAKASYGIKGLMEIPELKEGDTNDFLTRLIAHVKEKLAEEAAALKPQKEAYKKAITAGLEIIAKVDAPEKVMVALGEIRALDHALTSQKELEARLKFEAKGNGWTYSKEAGGYVAKVKQEASLL